MYTQINVLYIFMCKYVRRTVQDFVACLLVMQEMTSAREEQSRVRSLLLDTVSLLCKNGLTFKKQMKIQGLLGITLDEDDVFIVHINDAVGETIENSKNLERRNSRDVGKTPEKSTPRKRSAVSSPASRGPVDKRRAAGDVIVISGDERNQSRKSMAMNARGGMASVRNQTPPRSGPPRPVMMSPNRMQFFRPAGSPIQVIFHL